jgi:hypothetical protein
MAALCAAPATAQAASATAQRTLLTQAQHRFARLKAHDYDFRFHECWAGAGGGYTGVDTGKPRVLKVRGGHDKKPAKTIYFGKVTTVASLFAIVGRNVGRHDFKVRYSAKTGVPVSMSFDFKGIADSRRGFTVSGFHRVTKHT